MKTTKSWLLLGALAAVGCSSGEFRPEGALSAPLGPFRAVEVRPPETEPQVREALDAEQRERLDAFVCGYPERLSKALEARGLLAPAGPAELVVETRLVRLEPGDRTLRWALGFGAGKGTVEARVVFREAGGPVLASGLARGTISGGVFGGSFETAETELVRAIADYLEGVAGPR